MSDGNNLPGIGIPRPNAFERIPFAIFGVDEAATSQGTNLNTEKVNIAWREALSLWGTASPIDFDPARASEEPLLRLRFIHNGNMGVLGTTSGSISRTPAGPVGMAGIEISLDNDFFLDRFLEPVRHPTGNGPFDLTCVIAHEVGHALGLDHPPKDPNTGQEIESGIMSPVKGTAVQRQLFPYDIRGVQARHRAIKLAEAVKANWQQTGQLIDASRGVVLEKDSFGLLAFGPVESRALLDVVIPAKEKWVNALRLKFTTVTQIIFVNRVQTFDGIVPLQEFATSARCNGGEGLAGRSFDLHLGFLRRPVMQNDMLVRMELIFKRGEAQSEFGVLQLPEVSVETLTRPVEDV